MEPMREDCSRAVHRTCHTESTMSAAAFGTVSRAAHFAIGDAASVISTGRTNPCPTKTSDRRPCDRMAQCPRLPPAGSCVASTDQQADYLDEVGTGVASVCLDERMIAHQACAHLLSKRMSRWWESTRGMRTVGPPFDERGRTMA